MSLSNILKVTGNRTTYNPLDMTDASVYDLARHYYTFHEICEMFNVTAVTLEEKHGEAFRAGKANAMMKPRMLLNKLFDDFLTDGLDFTNKDVPVERLLKAIEIHARKYEGYGQEQKVTVSSAAPSISDIIFNPLKTQE